MYTFHVILSLWTDKIFPLIIFFSVKNTQENNQTGFGAHT